MKYLILLSFLISLNSYALVNKGQMKDLLSGHKCKKQIIKLLSNWKSNDSWQKIANIDLSRSVYKTPSHKIGSWIRMDIQNNKAIVLQKMTSKMIISKEFAYDGNSCSGEMAVRSLKYDEKYLSQSFTDAELINSLSQNKKGIIYIWSPNMPLSVTGLKYLKKHAKKMGVHVTAVVDPNSPKSDIDALVTSGKIDKEALRPLESYDLIQRGGLIHFPAFFSYENGKLSRAPKLGYEDDKQTLNYLKKQF
ncbi:MAG: hypothetical protein HN576_14640 [Bacteriovoracaceae bacterium]|nr:hypothetical protein [Bacteriovoracaceae bacterium]